MSGVYVSKDKLSKMGKIVKTLQKLGNLSKTMENPFTGKEEERSAWEWAAIQLWNKACLGDYKSQRLLFKNLNFNPPEGLKTPLNDSPDKAAVEVKQLLEKAAITDNRALKLLTMIDSVSKIKEREQTNKLLLEEGRKLIDEIKQEQTSAMKNYTHTDEFKAKEDLELIET